MIQSQRKKLRRAQAEVKRLCASVNHIRRKWLGFIIVRSDQCRDLSEKNAIIEKTIRKGDLHAAMETCVHTAALCQGILTEGRERFPLGRMVVSKNRVQQAKRIFKNVKRLERHIKKRFNGHQRAVVKENAVPFTISAPPVSSQSLISKVFDKDYYIKHNSDVVAEGLDPLLHYLECGWREGRNPNAFFNVNWYLEQNEDVLNAGLEPLNHYLEFGWKEMRFCSPSPAAMRKQDDIKGHPELKVFYISGEPNTPGNLYRVIRPVESLLSVGHKADWTPLHEALIKKDAILDADVIVVWRAPWDAVLQKIINEARLRGVLIVFDVDDLMFNPALATSKIIDGIRSQAFDEKAVEDFFERVATTMRHADICLAPTLSLAKAMYLFSSKPSMVVPNGFNAAVQRSSRKARAVHLANHGNENIIRIGYAVGSKTHQRDFAQCEKALLQVLREHPECRLVLFRDIKSSRQDLMDVCEFPELQALYDQIEWRMLVPLSELPSEIARFDINLAPLEVGNPFCEAKSELKYFEAALVEVPTIASPTQPFSAAIQDGVTGYLAATQQEWYDKLKTLICNKKLRSEIGTNAYHDVLWRYGSEHRGELLSLTFGQFVGNSRQRSRSFELKLRREKNNKQKLPIIPDSDVIFESGDKAISQVAVVIPLYNYESYVLEALNSLLAQTNREIEIIVVDDCSKDNSMKLVESWMKKNCSAFNYVRLMKNRNNSGLALTRNAAIAAADAPFVFPLDADNLFKPKCVERCLCAIVKSDAAFVYPQIRKFGLSDIVFGAVEWQPVRLKTGNYIDAMALVRKSAWASIGGYIRHQVQGWEDYRFWCDLAAGGFYGEHVPEELALYRVHGTSMLNTETDVSKNKQLVIREMLDAHPWLELKNELA